MDLTFVFDGYISVSQQPLLFVFDGYIISVPQKSLADGSDGKKHSYYGEDEDEERRNKLREQLQEEDEIILTIIKQFVIHLN